MRRLTAIIVTLLFLQSVVPVGYADDAVILSCLSRSFGEQVLDFGIIRPDSEDYEIISDCIVSSEQTEECSVYVGSLRGDTLQVCLVIGDQRYEGILDFCHNTVLWPQQGIEVCSFYFGDEYTLYTPVSDIRSTNVHTNETNSYFGGKDAGLYWLYDYQNDRVAFYDIPSGYFSGYLFHPQIDYLFWDESAKYIRVTMDGERYYYVDRQNGAPLSILLFSGENCIGMKDGYAIERLYGTQQYVVMRESGEVYYIPDGFAVESYMIENNSLYLVDTAGTISTVAMDDESVEWRIPLE